MVQLSQKVIIENHVKNLAKLCRVCGNIVKTLKKPLNIYKTQKKFGETSHMLGVKYNYDYENLRKWTVEYVAVDWSYIQRLNL